MRLQEIIGIIRDNLYLGIAGVIALGLVMGIGYFIIYKKLLGGKKLFPKKKLIPGALLVIYIIMVLGVTLLNRTLGFHWPINLQFLSSYREAWNSFSARHWQFVILNIVMFLPLGILLPLSHIKFRKAVWTAGAGLLLTLTIESLQFFTGLGSFVLDDIFNNFLGAIIGYGLVMGTLVILNEKQKRFRKAAVYFSPLIIVALIFTGIFIAYNLQEFGNLSIAYNYRINMKDTQVTLNVDLTNEKTLHPIYQAPVFTKKSARDFAVGFMENLDIDTSNLEAIEYSNSGIYRVQGNPSYSVWINYVGGTYSFSDFSSFNNRAMQAEEEDLIEKVKMFGIQIPQSAEFNERDVGNYEWKVNKKVINGHFTDGTLSISHYEDGTIKNIRNHMVVFNKMRNVPIKSEKDAYQEILDGKFSAFYLSNRMETVNIYGVKVDYHMDSKGFYQPVYRFDCIIDGNDFIITIPALLR